MTHLSLRIVGQEICSLLQSNLVVGSPCLQLLHGILGNSTLTQQSTHLALDHAAEVLQLDNLGIGRRNNGLPGLPLGSGKRDTPSFRNGKGPRLATVYGFMCQNIQSDASHYLERSPNPRLLNPWKVSGLPGFDITGLLNSLLASSFLSRSVTT